MIKNVSFAYRLIGITKRYGQFSGHMQREMDPLLIHMGSLLKVLIVIWLAFLCFLPLFSLSPFVKYSYERKFCEVQIWDQVKLTALRSIRLPVIRLDDLCLMATEGEIDEMVLYRSEQEGSAELGGTNAKRVGIRGENKSKMIRRDLGGLQ